MKVRIYELEQGERFKWNGTTYIKGKECRSNLPGVFYRCKPVDCSDIAERPFSGNLEVEKL